MLLFKKKFLDAIRAGKKTQTIRLWPFRRMRTGQRSYIPGVGYVQIELVEEITLDQLTESDAVADGFATMAELLNELETLYAKELATGYQAFRVRFVRLGESAEGSA